MVHIRRTRRCSCTPELGFPTPLPLPRCAVSPLLQVVDLSFSHGEIPVVDRVCFALEPGCTGLVGANGAGKSTLLALLAGRLLPAAGAIRAAGDVHLCPQEAVLDDAV